MEKKDTTWKGTFRKLQNWVPKVYSTTFKALGRMLLLACCKVIFSALTCTMLL